MDLTEFSDLIKHLEDYSVKNPKMYKLRVCLVALLGYLYLIAMLILLPLVFFGIGWLIWDTAKATHRLDAKVVMGYLVFGGSLLLLLYDIVCSLWVTFPKPRGREITESDAPELFASLKQISEKFNISPIDHVLIDLQLNAAIYQYPRLGIFGWYKNYLIIGFPLLVCCTKEQFQAILTHELGHISENHGEFGVWIARLRVTWGKLLLSLDARGQTNSGAGYLFSWFCEWFTPYFTAYSLVLQRAQELVSDRYAATFGETPFAEALISLELKGRYLANEFWPKLQERSFREKLPPPDAVSKLTLCLKENPSDVVGQSWLLEALEKETSLLDSHPSLSDRLRALGFNLEKGTKLKNIKLTPFWVQKPEIQTAAKVMLGGSFQNLLEEFNVSWQNETRITWVGNYSKSREEMRELEVLQERGEAGQLSIRDSVDLINKTFALQGIEQTLPLIRNFLSKQPDHPQINFLLGSSLLKKDDSSGIQFLEKAMEKDAALTLSASELLHEYWQRLGNIEKAELYRTLMKNYCELWDQSQSERSGFTPDDVFDRHSAPEESIIKIKEILKYKNEIREAYLIQKRLSILPEIPFFVLGIAIDRSRTQMALGTEEERLEDEILVQGLYVSLQFLRSFMIIPLKGEWANFILVMSKIEGSKIY